MQQTSTPPVVGSSSATQVASNKPAASVPAPLPLSTEVLRQISGGTATLTPNGTW